MVFFEHSTSQHVGALDFQQPTICGENCLCPISGGNEQPASTGTLKVTRIAQNLVHLMCYSFEGNARGWGDAECYKLQPGGSSVGSGGQVGAGPGAAGGNAA